MIQVCSLYSLEIVKPIYYVTTDLRVINIVTNIEKSLSINKGGYPYVSLETIENRTLKVPIHKIIALAFIYNGPYKLIEHLDDNKLNYSLSNLKFSDSRSNTLNAFKNGKIVRYESIFRVVFDNYDVVGSMYELSQQLGISRGTLYDIYYNKRFLTNKQGIKNIYIVGQQTVESRSNA